MSIQHHYATTITWTGNKGTGTSRYDEYERAHSFSVEGKADILCSSDTPFRGDGSKHNPEDMLVYSLSSCHMLWYLHLCADAGLVVFSFSSCVQSYDCECITTENGVEVFRATDSYAGSKQSVQKICDDFEENQNKTFPSPGKHTDCNLK